MPSSSANQITCFCQYCLFLDIYSTLIKIHSYHFPYILYEENVTFLTPTLTKQFPINALIMNMAHTFPAFLLHIGRML